MLIKEYLNSQINIKNIKIKILIKADKNSILIISKITEILIVKNYKKSFYHLVIFSKSREPSAKRIYSVLILYFIQE